MKVGQKIEFQKAKGGLLGTGIIKTINGNRLIVESEGEIIRLEKGIDIIKIIGVGYEIIKFLNYAYSSIKDWIKNW